VGLGLAGVAAATPTGSGAANAKPESAAKAVSDDSYTGGSLVHTGQLFFDPDINTEVQALAPYSDNTTPETTLANDSVYDGGGATSGLLALTALGASVSDGYAATLTMGVSSSG
jgi:hypothetical protein